jgi:ATP-binding cassette subfamily F protein 3
VSEVYELFQGNLKRYAGNYSAYEKVREVEIESLLKRYAEQQEEIARNEVIIRRFRYKASKAAMVQERVKRLEKMERVEIPESLKKISIAFPPPPHAGRIALTLNGVGKSYGERRILSGLDLTLESGEKLVVVGGNGAGKTTLLRIIACVDHHYEGSVQYGAGISTGYFSQDAAETMNGAESALEFMEAEAPTALIPKVRDMLGAFLFRGDDVYKSVSVLSGGEKSRLALLRLLLKPMNLLILDEPTNHLDLHSKDILLDTLRAYTGTVIFVSHDRAFMEALSTKTLELSPRGPRLIYGNYAYYQERLERERVDAENETREAIENVPAPQIASPVAPVAASGSAEQREAAKQRQTLIKRLERQEAEILARLEAEESARAHLEAELATPAVYSNGEKARSVKARLDAASARIDAASAEWEAKAAELERARG